MSVPVFSGPVNARNQSSKPFDLAYGVLELDGRPEGHYSTVTFQFEAAKSGTHLTFTQTGVPEEQYEDIAQGWRDYYWTPMKAMLAEETG